jgi:hypothetical protein
MEMMTEGTLSMLLRQYASKRIEAVEQAHSLIVGLDLMRQAAEGLAAAHALGVIHRDIKPDNLLLTRLGSSGEQYQLKISDFGLARLPESSGLSMGSPVGTPAYMSPEQCQNRTLDGRSDLYSLGVVLYEVVTGYSPFQINSFDDAVQKHVNALPPPLQQVYPNLPPPVEQIISRCLAKTPQERYQTGKELADALQEAINRIGVETGTPLVASPNWNTPKPLPSSDPPVSNEVSSKQKFGLQVPILVALTILIIVSSVVGVGIYQQHVTQTNALATTTVQTTTARAKDAATAQVEAYPAYLSGKGTLAFVDPLNKESGSKWRNEHEACQFIGGAYLVRLQDPRYFQPCGTSETYSNFAFEVHLTINQGGCGGVVFRDNSNIGNYYLFSICENGEYRVRKYVNNGSSTPLLQPGTTAINGLVQQNIIAVVASGSIMTFYVNEKQIGGQVQDSSYTSGRIALIAYPRGNPTSVAYTNARLWTL